MSTNDFSKTGEEDRNNTSINKKRNEVMINKPPNLLAIIFSICILIGVFLGYFGGYVYENYNSIANPNIFFDMASSLGTILSVSVALFLGLYPFLKSFFIRPILVLSVHDRGPTLEGMIQNYPDYEWDIILENIGRRTAKNITMRIKQVESLKEDRVIPYNEPVLMENFDLTWNNYIAKTIVYLGISYEGANIISLEYGDIGFTDCIIYLLITGDNFNGSEIKLKFTYSEDYDDTLLEIIC